MIPHKVWDKETIVERSNLVSMIPTCLQSGTPKKTFVSRWNTLHLLGWNNPSEPNIFSAIYRGLIDNHRNLHILHIIVASSGWFSKIFPIFFTLKLGERFQLDLHCSNELKPTANYCSDEYWTYKTHWPPIFPQQNINWIHQNSSQHLHMFKSFQGRIFLVKVQGSSSHRIHWDWYIYLHLPYKSTIHVGKYTSPWSQNP